MGPLDRRLVNDSLEIALAIALCTAPALLSGCATGMPGPTAPTASGTNPLGAAVPLAFLIAEMVELSFPAKAREIDKRTYPYGSAVVYELLADSAARQGATQVEQDDAQHVLRMTYPLSLTLWGGTIEFRCTEEGGNTVVSVTGISHDRVWRVRGISNKVLEDVERRLVKTP